jgi:transcription elongation factor Elf1
MTKHIRMVYTCVKCGQPGVYRYSYELATWLKLHSWQGVVLCNKCMEAINVAWREAKGASNVKASEADETSEKRS